MVSILLLSHGPLAPALAESAALVAGRRRGVAALELSPGDSPGAFRARVEAALKAALEEGEAVVLTDMVLGTPFNTAISLMGDYPFRHLSGMSLPLLLALLNARERGGSAEEVCAAALEDHAAQPVDVDGLVRG